MMGVDGDALNLALADDYQPWDELHKARFYK
jgi:hypothetical protein